MAHMPWKKIPDENTLDFSPAGGIHVLAMYTPAYLSGASRYLLVQSTLSNNT